MDYKATANEILELVGGAENVNELTHCITRLRFILVKKELAEIEKLEAVNGVLGAQFKSGQLQVIIGPDVDRVFNEFPKSLMIGENKKEEKEENLFNRTISTFSGFFYPLVMAMGGAGIIKGFLALAVNYSWVSQTSDVYVVLNLLSDCLFYFLPFFLAVSVAQKLKVNVYMALTMAAMLMYPTLINGAAEKADALRFFGLTIPQYSYASTVIPIILSVICLKYVFQFLSKFIPKSLEMVATSALTLIITGIITLVILAPMGIYIGNYVSSFFSWLYRVAGPLASIVTAATFPLTIITGMAYSFMPITFMNLATQGFDFFRLPYMVLSNINQSAATLAVALKTGDARVRATALSAGFTALLGITEPAMYSVNLRYKRPFYFAMAGNALGGLLGGLFNLKMFGAAGGGIFAIPAYGSIDYPNNFLHAMICMAAGVALTFTLTFVFTPKSSLTE